MPNGEQRRRSGDGHDEPWAAARKAAVSGDRSDAARASCRIERGDGLRVLKRIPVRARVLTEAGRSETPKPAATKPSTAWMLVAS
jgi:hypothetical protein